MCHVSLFFLFCDKVAGLVVGGSVINGAFPSSFNKECFELKKQNNFNKTTSINIHDSSCYVNIRC